MLSVGRYSLSFECDMNGANARVDLNSFPLPRLLRGQARMPLATANESVIASEPH